MTATDLNLSNPALAGKAIAMGWKVFTAKVFPISKQGQVPSRPLQEIVSVESEDGELLRRASASGGVDLLNPLMVKDFYKDEGLIRAVAEQEKSFEIPLEFFLKKEFVHRTSLLARASGFLKKCVKLGARVVFTSRAVTEYDLKSPREVLAVLQLLGLSKQQAEYAMGPGAEKVLKNKSGVA